MRNFDPDLMAEFAKEVFRFFHMIEFQFNQNWYFTDMQFPIYKDGHKYLPRGLDVGTLNVGSMLSVDKTTITIDDADLMISAILENEDTRNKPAILYIGAINANYEVIACDAVFRGFVDSWELPEPNASITISNELARWRDKTLRTASVSCPWVFNGLMQPYQNLITAWANGSPGYGTFTSSGADVTSAINASGAVSAHSVGFSVTDRKLYKLLIDLTLNSGQAPNISNGRNGLDTGWLNTPVVLSAGVNEFVWEAVATNAAEYILFANTAAANWSATVKLYQVTECGYLGIETWCDQSYDRCLSIGNNLNFGGFRFLPAVMEKEIWWGRNP